MKWKTALFSLGILLLWIYPTPNYRELNHLKIIQSMQIVCDVHSISLSFREIEPIKEENGVRYHYQDYHFKGNNLAKILKSIDSRYGNTFYFDGVQKVYTNCDNFSEIRKVFSLSSSISIQKRND